MRWLSHLPWRRRGVVPIVLRWRAGHIAMLLVGSDARVKETAVLWHEGANAPRGGRRRRRRVVRQHRPRLLRQQQRLGLRPRGGRRLRAHRHRDHGLRPLEGADFSEVPPGLRTPPPQEADAAVGGAGAWAPAVSGALSVEGPGVVLGPGACRVFRISGIIPATMSFM